MGVIESVDRRLHQCLRALPCLVLLPGFAVVRALIQESREVGRAGIPYGLDRLLAGLLTLLPAQGRGQLAECEDHPYVCDHGESAEAVANELGDGRHGCGRRHEEQGRDPGDGDSSRRAGDDLAHSSAEANLSAESGPRERTEIDVVEGEQPQHSRQHAHGRCPQDGAPDRRDRGEGDGREDHNPDGDGCKAQAEGCQGGLLYRRVHLQELLPVPVPGRGYSQDHKDDGRNPGRG